jgi:hypothetical protein
MHFVLFRYKPENFHIEPPLEHAADAAAGMWGNAADAYPWRAVRYVVVSRNEAKAMARNLKRAFPSGVVIQRGHR